MTLVALLAITVAAFADAPKYIFYFIGDGMGMGPVMSAATYNRVVLGNDRLPLMMTFPVAGQVMTYSASSPVTDSAAAGTALATGTKTKNGMIGMNPDTIAVSSVADFLIENGYGIGLVTNVAPDDATPSVFYAHVPSRYMRTDIDRQFAAGKVDFLAGSALTGLTNSDGTDTGVLDLCKDNGIAVVKGLDELQGVKETADRIILLDKNPFSSGNTGYVIDEIPGMILLPEMTQACISHLERTHPDKFFMMVEGGNIDHALHANDGLSAITEIYNFNNALQLAYDFMLAHPEETLIVVTADHDTGGMSVGNGANGYSAHFDLLSNQKISKEMFSDLCKNILKAEKPMTWEEMKAMLTEKFGFWEGIKLSDKETDSLEKLFTEVFVEDKGTDEKTLYNNFNAFASKVFGLVSTKAAVGWTSGAHTGNPVPVYAAGVGAERFGRVLNNSEIPGLIIEIASGK